MTRSEFDAILRVARTWGNAVYAFGAVVMLLLFCVAYSWFAEIHEMTAVFRDKAKPLADDGRYGAIIGLLIGSFLLIPSMLLPLLLVVWVDRRIGAACPMCHASITLWNRGVQVQNSGTCGKCDAKVLAPDISDAHLILSQEAP